MFRFLIILFVALSSQVSFAQYQFHFGDIVPVSDGWIIAGTDVLLLSDMNTHVVVGKFKLDGTVDDTFGTHGWVRIAIQPDGQESQFARALNFGFARNENGHILVGMYRGVMSDLDSFHTQSYSIVSLDMQGHPSQFWSGPEGSQQSFDAYVDLICENETDLITGEFSSHKEGYGFFQIDKNGNIKFHKAEDAIGPRPPLSNKCFKMNDGRYTFIGINVKQPQIYGLNSDLTLDRFSKKGVRRLSFPQIPSLQENVVTDIKFWNNSFLVSNFAQIGSGNGYLQLPTLHKFSADGTLDTSFSPDLKALGFIEGLYRGGELAINPQTGDLDLLSYKFQTDDLSRVTRIKPNGQVDTSFGKNGSLGVTKRSTYINVSRTWPLDSSSFLSLAYLSPISGNSEFVFMKVYNDGTLGWRFDYQKSLRAAQAPASVFVPQPACAINCFTP